MTILDFDELNSFREFREELLSMKPSEIMDQKERLRDEVEWLLEFAYMLGFDRAREELGVIAEDLQPFLPSDYVTPTSTSLTPNVSSLEPIVPSLPSDYVDTPIGYATETPELPKDYNQRMSETVNKEIAGKTYADRVLEHAELGDAQAILRVAETDGNRVYNSGGLLGARGLATTKTWETMQDDRVRETHDYLQSMTVPIDEDFYTYDGDHAPCPGEFENPANSVGCRCWLSFNK